MGCAYCEEELKGLQETDRHWKILACESCGEKNWVIVAHGVYLVTRKLEDSPVVARREFGGTMFRIVEVMQGSDKDIIRYQGEAWRSEEKTEIVTTPTMEAWRACTAMAGAATTAMVEKEQELEATFKRFNIIEDFYHDQQSRLTNGFWRLMRLALDLSRGVAPENNEKSQKFEEAHGW